MIPASTSLFRKYCTSDYCKIYIYIYSTFSHNAYYLLSELVQLIKIIFIGSMLKNKILVLSMKGKDGFSFEQDGHDSTTAKVFKSALTKLVTYSLQLLQKNCFQEIMKSIMYKIFFSFIIHWNFNTEKSSVSNGCFLVLLDVQLSSFDKVR